MREVIVLGVLVLVGALATAGCGSSSGDDSSGSSSGGGSSATITLPDGWAMTDALSAEEVGALTGKTMEVFPEASSAAQDGKPAGGYTASGVDGSKIYFGVDVQGGEAGYENQMSYAESGSVQEVSGVGDKAAVVAFSDGRAGIIALKGDAVVRVDWDPQVYPDDPADFGSRLANALLATMYE
jgi:hypothetical protein